MGSDEVSGSTVQTERHGAVLLVRLHRPEARNAMNHDLMWELREAFEAAATDPGVRAVVTTGSGAQFSVGADLGALAGGPTAPSRPGRYGMPPVDGDDLLGPGRWRLALEALDKPTIAALNGSAAGGGLCTALLHDFRVAASTARFATAFVGVGLSPEMGMTELLPALVGRQHAARLLLTGDVVDAAEALRIGLVDEVCAPDAVVARALELADRLAGLAPLAVQATKRLLRDAAGSSRLAVLEAEQAAQRALFATADHREAVAAFRERRPGRFEGC
jgi:enoyl-CoA hydratase/carnithine racemase